MIEINSYRFKKNHKHNDNKPTVYIILYIWFKINAIELKCRV